MPQVPYTPTASRLPVLLLTLSVVAAASFQIVSASSRLRSNDHGENVGSLIARRLNSSPTDEDKTVPFNSWDNTIDTLQYGLAFILVLVAAHPLGLFFPKCFKLPLITGYLVIGIIAGPFVANLLTEGIVTMLSNYVSALALSFISFQAGQEIYLPELRPQLKSIMILLGALYVTAMIILSSAILLAESAFFYDDMGFYCQLGIALMFGSISVLGSPATVMAIKIELNSVGPFTSLMLGATMTAEFVVLVSFSISRIVCSIYCAKLDVSMLNLVYTMGIVLANIVVGIVLAGLIILIFKIPRGRPHLDSESDAGFARTSMASHYDQRASHKMSSMDRDMAPHPHNAYDERTEAVKPSSCWSSNVSLSLKGFIWLTMGYAFYISTTTLAEWTAATYGLSWEIKFEPLLVLMIASCIAGHQTAIRHDMHVILDTVAPYMFLPFFVMTGAALKLDQVVAAIPLMSLYVGLRYVAIFIACYFGGRFLLKLTPRQYNNLWLTMTPQAGVALGLANEVKALSDESWAAEFSATIVAAVVVNQIIGPVLCAMGLSRAGETLLDRAIDADVSKEDVDNSDMSIQDGRLSSIHGGGLSSIHSRNVSWNGMFDVNRRMSNASMTMGNGDPRSLLPFYKVQNAVVIGDDEAAFEIALNLSLYGAHVNVPLLDEERTSKWKKMNETILAKGDLISYKNTLKDRDNAQAMSSADVLIFTGDANRTRENVHLLKSLLGASHPRMIAFVPDCKFSKEMKAQGVLVIQPSIALANIATRMALLDQKLAEALSNEISTTSDFNTAAYFLHPDGGSLSEMRLEGRRLALGRSVVNHHSVDYDRLAEYGLAFILVLVAAHPLGLFFPKCFKLPLITGYLVIGIIAGPFVANLLTEGIVTMLSNYVSALALSFISFQAGQEIYLPELRPQLKSIMILLGALYVTAMIILSSAILLAESAFFYDDMGFYCQLGIALMFGSISVLGSPATVMAIKIELNSVGPFTSLMLGATMTAEFVVLVSFSVSRIVCSIYCAKLDVSMLNLVYTMGIVLANIVVGVVLAGLIILIFKIPGGNSHVNHGGDIQTQNHMTPHHERADTEQSTSCWSSNAALSLKGFIWLTMGYAFYISTTTLAEWTAATYGLSWEIKFEPLLVLMIASCIAGHQTAIRHDMHVILDTVAPYMFLPFFVMTGAALKLDQVVAAIPLMSLYVGLRYVAIFIACYFGGRFLLKLTPRQYNNLWLTMTPQAGVALGLANEVKAMSDESWAAEFAATIVAAVVVNQIVGPVLCAMGLGQAGETLQDRTVEEHDHKNDHDNKHLDTETNTELRVHQGRRSSRSSFSAYTNQDLETPSPFCKVKDAVVIGDDEIAFEIALNLSLYGAHVNVPLLDKKRASKWKKINKTILKRAVTGDLISFKNTLKDRDNAQTMLSADVIIFTGDANRTRENIRMLKSLLGASHPRMIAFVPDCKFSKEMKAQGVLAIQPSIALANLATRMALLDLHLAEALSNEISTTSDFSTASYFLHPDADRGSLSEVDLMCRHLALGRSVVNHHSVDYDRLAEVLTAENLPMPLPPSRVSMFGKSAAGFNPFSTRGEPKSAHQHFVVEDEVVRAGTRTPDHASRPSVHFRIIHTP
ncbi:Necrosis inducing protein NPP1 type [Phytophthora cinnamomi]|uniref:Necrosis inducing protein NPP1 type n=1 Tax=Phytophthora cinnamomi TaxID=4785 RepID=UPI00355973FB|nr:Necrosis inducing protein NPP1 type [Phytophthora cinnamomi]